MITEHWLTRSCCQYTLSLCAASLRKRSSSRHHPASSAPTRNRMKESSGASHQRNAKTHPGPARFAAIADRDGARSPSLGASFSFREGPHTHNSGHSGEKDGSASARARAAPLPHTLPRTPSPRWEGPGGRGPAALTRLLGAVAARRQLVHLDAGPAALQHRQAPARAAHLARRLSSSEQRAAEPRGAGEEPELRAPRLRGGPGRGGPGCGGRPRRGDRPARRARAAPRPPPWPLLHRCFPGLPGRTSVLRTFGGDGAPAGREARVERQTAKSSNCARTRQCGPAERTAPRRRGTAAAPTPPLLGRLPPNVRLGGGAGRSSGKRKGFFFLRGRYRNGNRKGNRKNSVLAWETVKENRAVVADEVGR